jgi:hypothetical protein
MRMRVQILHNQNERHSFIDGYTKDDPLVRVFDGEPPYFEVISYREDPEVGLNYIYEANQHLFDTHPWNPDVRSLSKGDVIVLGEKAYAIESMGFKELTGFEVPA